MDSIRSSITNARRILLSAIACTSLVVAAPIVRPPAAAATGNGYWLLGGDGGLFSFNAPFFGSAASDPNNCAQDMGAPPNCTILSATPDSGGYYIVNPLDGGHVFNFGDAPSLASLGLEQPSSVYVSEADFLRPFLVALQITQPMQGLFIVESNGDILTAGDAPFSGQQPPEPPHPPASAYQGPNPTPFAWYVGGAMTPSEQGYWVTNNAGAVFSFGDAQFFGSMEGVPLNAAISSMTVTPDGGGYWLLASDGGIFSFGDAHFYGSTGNIRLNAPVVGMASTPDGGGSWLVASDGGIFSFGDAVFHGSTGNLHINSPVTAMASA